MSWTSRVRLQNDVCRRRKEGDKCKIEKGRSCVVWSCCWMDAAAGEWGRGGGRGGRKKERGGWLTRERLEPQWLARIRPHSSFDEGWILKLNQSHMSPTVRRGRRRGQKKCWRETKGVVKTVREKWGRGEERGKRQIKEAKCGIKSVEEGKNKWMRFISFI